MRRKRGEQSPKQKRKQGRGFTLIEALVVMSVMAAVLVPILGISGYLGRQWGAQVGRAKAMQAATLAMEAMLKETGKCVSFVSVATGNKANVFTLPLDVDAKGNYTPVYSSGKIVYQAGTLVRYYLSDATGAASATGNILWREVKSGSSWVADKTWSLSPGSTTRGNIANVSALSFTTSGLPLNTVRISLTVAIVENKMSSSYTLQRDVYLSNHN